MIDDIDSDFYGVDDPRLCMNCGRLVAVDEGGWYHVVAVSWKARGCYDSDIVISESLLLVWNTVMI